MHSMRERISMNREEMIINVHLEQEEMIDYLVFEFDQPKKVNLNEESNQNQLKEVFIDILSRMVSNKVKIVFVDNEEYRVGLYIDVCKEYIKDLNREINNVAKTMPD